MSTSSPSHTTRARSRCPGIPVRIAEGADGQDLLGASLSLAQTQIAGQLAEETSLDSRLMGALGFTGALIGADIAIRDARFAHPSCSSGWDSLDRPSRSHSCRQLSTGAFMSTDPHTTKPRPPIPPAPVPIELPGLSGIPHMSPSGEIPPPSWYEELFMRVFGPRRSKRRRSS